jgi:hypothetical protein
MKEQILMIAKDLEQGTIDTSKAQNLLLGLFSVSNCDFKTVKVGDFLKCIKLYPQSKKYTVDKTYQVIKERNDEWHGEQIAIRDDHDKLTWITRKHGISYTDFVLVSCC